MLVTDVAPPQTVPADNAPQHDLPPEGAPPADAPSAKPVTAAGALIAPGSTGVVLLPIVLRDVAVATAGVSALLVAGGIVRARPRT
jgi:hypothetical protein